MKFLSGGLGYGLTRVGPGNRHVPGRPGGDPDLPSGNLPGRPRNVERVSYSEGPGAFRSLIRWLYEIYRASKTSDVLVFGRYFLNEGARTVVKRSGCPRIAWRSRSFSVKRTWACDIESRRASAVRIAPTYGRMPRPPFTRIGRDSIGVYARYLRVLDVSRVGVDSPGVGVGLKALRGHSALGSAPLVAP